MRRWLSMLILILAVCQTGYGQKHRSGQDEKHRQAETERQESIIARIKELDKALIASDTGALNNLLDAGVTIRHSNGMMESKAVLLEHIQSGYVTYTEIQQDGPARIQAWAGKKGMYWKDHTVIRDLHVTGKLNGEPLM